MSFVAICWQGLLVYSEQQEEPQTELSVSLTVPYLFVLHYLSQSLQENPGFIFLPRLRPAGFNKSYTNCILSWICTDQSEWHDLETSSA